MNNINVINMLNTMKRAHEQIREFVEFENEAGAAELLIQCIQASDALKEYVFPVLSYYKEGVDPFDEYEKTVRDIHDELTRKVPTRVYEPYSREVKKRLDEALDRIELQKDG